MTATRLHMTHELATSHEFEAFLETRTQPRGTMNNCVMEMVPRIKPTLYEQG